FSAHSSRILSGFCVADINHVSLVSVFSSILCLFSRLVACFYLLSFPTRRSSDLFFVSEHPNIYLQVLLFHLMCLFLYDNPSSIPDRKSTRLKLQSRFDLVCRLLLEKKKN